MKLKLNNKIISDQVIGERSWGGDEVLALKQLDLFKNTPYSNEGYFVKELLNAADSNELRKGVQKIIENNLYNFGIKDSEVKAKNYHRYITTEEQHHAFLKMIAAFLTNSFPIAIEKLIEPLSLIFNTPLTLKNPETGFEFFHIRVVRPNSIDYNPLHRDVWLSRLANGINLYIPICGSNNKSSLPLVEGSHLWNEKDVEKTTNSWTVNGKHYSVPAVTDTRQKLQLIRPNPRDKEILVFSPYLLHGAAYNFNKDVTRISLEIRLWKKQD